MLPALSFSRLFQLSGVLCIRERALYLLRFSAASGGGGSGRSGDGRVYLAGGKEERRVGGELFRGGQHDRGHGRRRAAPGHLRRCGS